MSLEPSPTLPPPLTRNEVSARGDDEQPRYDREDVKAGARTPRPYFRDGGDILQHERDDEREGEGGRNRDREEGEGGRDIHEASGKHIWSATPSGRATPSGGGGASESGTEADDERPGFIKALPAPHLRPRKGLKVGEANEEVLLTPSQLDDEGRRLSEDYFHHERGPEKKASEREEKAEQEKLLRRRLGELARRSSEVGLLVVIVASVLCGRGVLAVAAQWKWELLAHVAIIGSLVLAYPVKLSIVDTSASGRTNNRLWERFRVPASFDPATVLYPPLLPVLIALSVSPANSATVLPNIVIGLASLPQRLFPRSSRLGGINTLHWLVSILPLIAADSTAWPSAERSSTSYSLKCSPPDGLSPETLVSLYPLHHMLLLPLYHLTTSSLLISELHLLSAALINLLLLSASPQTNILKACLLVGGVTLFVACGPVLHWNVTLARIPKWKLRRPEHAAQARRSLVDAVSELINLQRAAAAFATTAEAPDSDADEDEPRVSFKQMPGARLPRLSMVDVAPHLQQREPKSAIEARDFVINGSYPEAPAPGSRPRRNTLPPRGPPFALRGRPSSGRTNRGSKLLWCLQLTPAEALRRKWLYAGYVYFSIAVIILGPVRAYISKKALMGHEPIGWAIGYLFGQIELLRWTVDSLGLRSWVPLPAAASSWRDARITFPLDVPSIRTTLGVANVHLLLVAYWACVLAAGLLAVFSLTAYVEVDTRRKVFHGVMVAMLLPATFVDPCYTALALALILSIFLILEVIRAGQVPPLGNAIGRFVAPYVDGRDLRGPVVVSHNFLLVGCAVPLWFSLASMARESGGDGAAAPWAGWELAGNTREVAMVAGVVCVGMGDAAASLVGRRLGRHKWVWVGGKSVEGSAAFALAVTAGLMAAKAWLVVGGWADTDAAADAVARRLGSLGVLPCVAAWLGSLAKALFCACAASFMEAVLTGANDNVVVPVALWLLVKGVGV